MKGLCMKVTVDYTKRQYEPPFIVISTPPKRSGIVEVDLDSLQFSLVPDVCRQGEMVFMVDEDVTLCETLLQDHLIPRSWEKMKKIVFAASRGSTSSYRGLPLAPFLVFEGSCWCRHWMHYDPQSVLSKNAAAA